MLGVLTGCGIIGVVVLTGYLLGRGGLLGAGAGMVLNRTAFFVATPALIFGVLSKSDLQLVFSSYMALAIVGAVVCAVLYLAIAALAFRQPLAETAIGTASAIFVNSNNMGLPVAFYVLGDASAIAAILILQPLIISPLLLTLLDVGSSGRLSMRAVLTQPVRNPIILAAVLGVIVAAAGWHVPPVLADPLELLGGAAIPIVLLAFGMSLHGGRPLVPGTGRKQVLVATLIKSVVMPIVAFLAARFALGLDAELTFAAVILAALPTGQLIYNYAAYFERGVVVARDTVLLTTALAAPVMLLAAALLA